MSTIKRAEAKVSFFLPRELRAGIEALARENERSLSGEVRVALSRHLEHRQLRLDETEDAPVAGYNELPEGF